MVDFQHQLVGQGLGPGRRADHALALAADHQFGHFHHGGFLGVPGSGQLAVPQNGDGVGGGHHLFQAVGDEDDGDAALGDLLHHLDELLGLAFGEHGGGLVEHQQLDAGFVDFPGDLHELHVAHGQPLHQGIFLNGHAHLVQRLAGVPGHGRHIQGFQVLAQHPADQVGAGNFPVEFDILGNGKAGQQHEFLMNHADALEHGLVGRGDVDLFPVDGYASLKAAGGVDHRHAKQHVHQGGFARAVLAQQRVNFPRPDGQGYVLQHRILPVPLGDVFHFQHIFRTQAGIPPYGKPARPVGRAVVVPVILQVILEVYRIQQDGVVVVEGLALGVGVKLNGSAAQSLVE